jgi:hypothetical protein
VVVKGENVVVKGEKADECTRPPTKYSLRAVIVHMGSAQMASILKSQTKQLH